MGNFKYGFLLDENVVALQSLFPKGRAKTVNDFSLAGKADSEVIKKAGEEAFIVVTSDAQYIEFFRQISASNSQGRHIHGLVIVTPTDFEKQKRLFPIAEIEKKMTLNGMKMNWQIVSEYNLLVRVEENRRVTTLRLPLCPCADSETRKQADKVFGKVSIE
jgi:hypothetical protein